jgi:hypothetical protein
MVLVQVTVSRSKMKVIPFLSPCAKVKSKWIKDIHIKPDVLTLIEEKSGKSLKHIGTGEIFLKKKKRQWFMI